MEDGMTNLSAQFVESFVKVKHSAPLPDVGSPALCYSRDPPPHLLSSCPHTAATVSVAHSYNGLES